MRAPTSLRDNPVFKRELTSRWRSGKGKAAVIGLACLIALMLVTAAVLARPGARHWRRSWVSRSRSLPR